MNKPLLVDIYCRVSTERQEDNTSLEEQERSCHEFCAKNGLTVAKVHKEVFSSHVYRERKILTLMRERYLSGQIQGVVVRTFDRLSRREVHMGVLLEEMEHHGIKLWASTEELDDSKIGRTTRMFLSMLAEWEWEKIHERVTTGRINAAKNGKVVAGKKTPYGWQWEYDDKGKKVRIVHHDSQIWVIRWMAIQYARGLSTMEISRQLTARDIPTPGDSQRDGKWQPIMIRRILTNERLTGKATVFGNCKSLAKDPLEPVVLPEGTYPPIISQELFDRLQERLQRNKEESSQRSKRHEEYLLRAGFIHCGYCGRRMHTRVDKNMKVHSNRPKRAMLNKYGELIAVPEGYQGSAIERLVYRCKGEDNAGNVWCKGQELRANEVDAWAWAELQKLADHIDIIKTAIELATNSNAMEADVKAIEVSLASWRQKATNYLQDLDDPNLRGDSRASIRQSLNAANQHIEELEVERTHVLMGLIDRDRERQAYEDILKWCETVKEARGELTYSQKRVFLHLLGVTVIAKRDEAGKLDLRMGKSLPEVRELIVQTDDIEAHDQ